MVENIDLIGSLQFICDSGSDMLCPIWVTLATTISVWDFPEILDVHIIYWEDMYVMYRSLLSVRKYVVIFEHTWQDCYTDDTIVWLPSYVLYLLIIQCLLGPLVPDHFVSKEEEGAISKLHFV